MNPKIPNEYFSVHWQGTLLVPTTETYTLAMVVDDRADLFLDGELILNGPWGHSSKEIFLKKGPHKIAIKYVQTWGEAYLKLYWARKKDPEQIIPAKYLRFDIKQSILLYESFTCLPEVDLSKIQPIIRKTKAVLRHR
ncbi:MAG: hypothetical protein HQL21_06060 [Candidatus Omnitrophica bacterium]|nr:hypothetical protein [Candidatus Omnitrophota bacterium]